MKVQLVFNAVSGEPTLHTAQGVDASDLVVVSPPQLPLV